MVCMALSILMLMTGCTQKKPHYVIGVSQCSADIWREKQNAELRMGAYLQGDVELRFAAAYDSDERQIEQIDSLVASGVDLLIVAPNQIATISPAIDRAFDQGIPVIVFERKTNSQKFTAFMGADNYEMGSVMGQYIISRLKGHGSVLEIKGLAGSSPAIERHNGFITVLKNAPDVKVVASLQGDWTEPRAYSTVKQWLAAHRERPYRHRCAQSLPGGWPSAAAVLWHRRTPWRGGWHPSGARLHPRRLLHLSHPRR